MTGGRWSGRRAQGGTAQPGEGRRTTSMTALRGKRALLDFPAPTTTRPALIARTACPCVANLPRADAVATQFRSMSRLLGFAVGRLPDTAGARRPSVFTQMVTAGSRDSSGRERSEGSLGNVAVYPRSSGSFGETRFAPRTWTDRDETAGTSVMMALQPVLHALALLSRRLAHGRAVAWTFR